MLQGNLQPGLDPAGKAGDESQEAVEALDVDDQGGGVISILAMAAWSAGWVHH
jgi:hypothetical protein